MVSYLYQTSLSSPSLANTLMILKLQNGIDLELPLRFGLQLGLRPTPLGQLYHPSSQMLDDREIAPHHILSVKSCAGDIINGSPERNSLCDLEYHYACLPHA